MKTRFTKALLAGALLTGLAVRSQAQVVINEYSASNLNTVTDAFGDYEDWVELYNPTGASVDLSGYYLTDDFNNPDNWAIPAGFSIPAGGRRMVFCSGRGIMTAVGGINQLHTDFKLQQCNGEKIALYSPALAVVDSVTMQRTQRGHSRGRTSDGAASWALFGNPTPNNPNSNPLIAYEPKVTFSIDAGFYAGAQSVTLTCTDATAQIRYTTNGAAPSATSALYTGPINMAATGIIRAAAFPTLPGYLKSFDENNTYFINETISPKMNIISVAGTYGALNGGGGNAPFNMIDSTSIEYFGTNHALKAESEGEWRRHGNDSWAYDQKGFRFHSRDELGYSAQLAGDLFSTTPRDSFKVLIFKAAGSDNYSSGFNYPNTAHIRDAFSHTLAEKWNLEMDHRRYEPAIVFVNGQYWGVYEVRERVDNEFTEYYYNQPEGKVDILRYWGGLSIEDGSDTGWVNLYDYIIANPMSNQANYEHVKDFLNVKSFIQYFIINTWLVNEDWLNWNTMWWRGRKGQGVKWRYALWDMDAILDIGGPNYTGLPTTGMNSNPCQAMDLFQNNDDIQHTDMLVALLQNPEFSQLYEDQFIFMLNGPLNCQNMVPHLDSLVANIQPEMQRHCTRWGKSYTQWQTNVAHLRNMMMARCGYIAQGLDSCMDLNPQRLAVDVYPAGVGYVKMDGNSLGTTYPWAQLVKADSNYTLQAVVTAPNWYFDHWQKDSVANIMTPNMNTATVGWEFHTRDSVVAVFKYFNPDSIAVTFNVDLPATGTIALDGVPMPFYPYTVVLDRTQTYNLTASPTMPPTPPGGSYYFQRWDRNHDVTTTIAPDTLQANITFGFQTTDTIVAYFGYTPPAPPPPPDAPQAPPPPGDGPGADVLAGLNIVNAFTPNGDGRNDYFYINGGRDFSGLEVHIFNRFGEEVFVSKDKTAKWDGTYKGQACDIGTYMYRVIVSYQNGGTTKSKTVTGDVMLIR